MALILSIEELLKPVTEEAPCGILTDAIESEILAVDAAIKRAPEIGFHPLHRVADGLFRGGQIRNLADLEGPTFEVKPVRHLKAAMVLTLSGLVSEGLLGFSDGLELIAKLLTIHWEHVHPVANPDDPEDPFRRRITILRPLSVDDPATTKVVAGHVDSGDSWQFLERLLHAPLLESDRHGALSLRDCLSPWAKTLKFVLPAGEDRSAEFVHEVRLGAAIMLPRQRQALQTAVAALKSIDQVFKEAPGTSKPNLDYLTRLLSAALDILEDRVTSLGPVPGAGLAGSRIPAASNGTNGPVASREEAVRKLAEAADYFRRNEPASPIPLLIDRVKRLASMNFMALLEELKLGDQAVPEFRKLAGIRETSPESSGQTGAGDK